MRIRSLRLILPALLLAAPAAGQAPWWDTPLLAPPQGEQGYAVYLTDPENATLGVMGTYRGGALGALRARIGIVDTPDDVGLLGGVDYSALLSRRRGELPLDVGWGVGVGAGFGNSVSTLSVPLALTFGLNLDADGLVIAPWVSPRLSLDMVFPDAGDSASDLNLLVDLGVDVQPSPRWQIRFGATLGDRDGVAVGLIL